MSWICSVTDFLVIFVTQITFTIFTISYFFLLINTGFPQLAVPFSYQRRVNAFFQITRSTPVLLRRTPILLSLITSPNPSTHFWGLPYILKYDTTYLKKKTFNIIEETDDRTTYSPNLLDRTEDTFWLQFYICTI